MELMKTLKEQKLQNNRILLLASNNKCKNTMKEITMLLE